MVDVEDMVLGAKNALDAVLGLSEIDSKDKRVLVITDERKHDVGRAFILAAQDLGAKETEMYTLPEDSRPLKEIPTELMTMIETQYPVIINAFEGLAEETPFRIKLIKAEIATGARVGHAPGITVDMMVHGPMTADYKAIGITATKLMKAFEDAEWVHITAPGGTDITVYIKGRRFETDVYIEPGTFGNLPAGEIWCAPIEDMGDGRIVCDGSIGDLGSVPSPITIEVMGGKVTAIHGDNPQLIKRIDELLHLDDMAYVIGELGIGLNPSARITGNLLEDEKAGRTAHIAFGNNEEMPGGRNNSQTHRDFLFHKPTIKVHYINGQERTLMKDGDLMI